MDWDPRRSPRRVKPQPIERHMEVFANCSTCEVLVRLSNISPSTQIFFWYTFSLCLRDFGFYSVWSMPSFHPSCTLPNGTVTFVSAPNVRGTGEILWSCLSILLLCTWSILHLNVPIEVQEKPTSWINGIKQNLYLLWKKIKWMVFVLLAPEMLLGTAVADLLSALTSEIDMNQVAHEDGVSWSLTHGFFANMGGFSIHFDGTPEPIHIVVPDAVPSEDLESNWESSAPVGRDETESSRNSIQSDTINSVVDIEGVDTTRKDLSAVPRFSGLEIDLDVTNLEMDRVNHAILPHDAEIKTFSTFDLTWDSKKIKRTLDSWLSLSVLAQKNKALPWRMGTSTQWKLAPSNIVAIMQVLHWQRCCPKEFIIPSYLNLAALQGNMWVLDARQLYLARRMGLIKLPDLPNSSLNDKNKGDLLVKTLAVVQIAWLIVQLITRTTRRYPSTQLEIMTLAFAVCSLVTYVVSLRKPQDVRVPIRIQAQRYPTPSEILTIANSGPVVWFDVILFLRWSSGRMRYWIPNTACHYVGERRWLGIRWRRFGTFWLGSAVGAVIVGGLHVLAWRSVFPTPAERILWRVAAILTLTIPVAYVVSGNIALAFFILAARFSSRRKLSSKDSKDKEKSTDKMVLKRTGSFRGIFEQSPSSLRIASMYYSGLSFLGISMYSLIRLFIIVEVFRSLVYIPPETYIATWTSNTPHLG
jgi:hypothetical protein